MNRHALLAGLHAKLRPRTYLEVGVHTGRSLNLSRVPSIGIDPDYEIRAELQADIHLARTTSDEFFARARPLAHLAQGDVIDLAFIDGMHLAEYALRDFLAVERFMPWTGVVVIDDMLPTTVEMAGRRRVTKEWTGDVYKVAPALRTLRPDLVVIEVDTAPTGTALVLLPDATRKGVLEGYDDWLVSTAVVPDPQDVPPHVLQRSRSVDPEELLSSSSWEELVALRDQTRSSGIEAVREACGDLVRMSGASGG